VAARAATTLYYL